MPESNTCFIDTNLWLYALLDAGEADKTKAAQMLVRSSRAIVSTQVISEVCANLIRKTKMPEGEIRKFIDGIYASHRVVELDTRAFLFASELHEEYSLSLWDSMIISAAFLSGAEVIYSEDIQDGLVIRESLQIKNPLQ